MGRASTLIGGREGRLIDGRIKQGDLSLSRMTLSGRGDNTPGQAMFWRKSLVPFCRVRCVRHASCLDIGAWPHTTVLEVSDNGGVGPIGCVLGRTASGQSVSSASSFKRASMNKKDKRGHGGIEFEPLTRREWVRLSLVMLGVMTSSLGIAWAALRKVFVD